MCPQQEVTSMARGIPTTNDKKDEHVQVLDSNPIPREVDLSPPNGRLVPELGAPVDRASIDPMQVAPVVRSALDGPPARTSSGVAIPRSQGVSNEDVPPARMFRVEAEKTIVDRTSGARTKLREGKEISSAHYDIRDLQRQGVKLRDITDLDPNAPL
jgi:hypothetical protein